MRLASVRAAEMALMTLEPFVPVMEAATEPYVQPILAGGVKVLPRWAEEDGVTKWRLKYRQAEPGERCAGRPGAEEDGRPWIELELRSFTRELPLSGLACGAEHYFKAALETPSGWSDWSNVVGCVPPAPTKPGKCAAVYCLVQGRETAVVRWTKPIDYAASLNGGGILRYRIRIFWPVPAHELGEQDFAGERFLDIEEDSDMYEVHGLMPLTNYRFQVAAENSAGWSDFSDQSAAITMPPPVPPALNQPTLRRATHHTVVIQWQHPPTSVVPLESFAFRWTTIADTVKSKSLGTNEDWSGATPVQELGGVPPNTSQYVIDGLDPGQTYVFQARALNTYGMAVWSESSIPIKTQEGGPPCKIQDFSKAHVYKSFITLQWKPAAENGYCVTEHALRVSTNEDMDGAEEITPAVVHKNGFDTCDLRHLNKAKYFFQVAAANQVGFSEWSDAASVDLTVVPQLADA